MLWLNERDLDIRCVRLRPYRLENRILLDVQQIIPLPEATAYQVQVRKKAIEQREATKFNPDFTKYDLTVDDRVYANLAKRWLIYRVVQATVQNCISPEKISELLPRGMGRWLIAEGDCDAAAFLSKKPETDPKRWFLGNDELIHFQTKTYVFSNQWALDSIPVVDRILSHYPALLMHYSKATQ